MKSKNYLLNAHIGPFFARFFGAKHSLIHLIILSGFLNLFLEAMSRRSLGEALSFLASRPHIFMYNALIIAMTLSICYLFARRNFVLLFLSAVWVGLGVANFVLLGFRTTPLAAIDFYIIFSVFDIIHIYLSTAQMIILGLLFFAALACLVWAWTKLTKGSISYKQSALRIGAMTLILFVVATIIAPDRSDFGNLADAYAKYGFAFSFATSVIDRGIDRPEDYSLEEMEEILRQIKAQGITPDSKPNIIMLQLESVFDVGYIKGLRLSDNPLPNYTELRENYSSGFLKVPSVGAGTANTEFEVIAGMSLQFFGLGEYPYKTILQSSTTETLPYNLAELGYTSHVLHNNTATFYNRHTVFPNLGFNSFVSIEYMNGIEYTPNSWARDDVLTGEIIKAMESSYTPDFIYAISVQAHGKYPNEVIYEDPTIKVLEAHDERYTLPMEYFVNQLYEVDQFLGDLIDELSDYPEPVVLVLFGDHLPSLGLDDEDLENGCRFDTEYIIWSNFPMEKQDVDLTSYQLGAYVMERLGFENGHLTRFHQRFRDSEEYYDKLAMLQYDMLYGEQYVFNGVNPYPATELQFGVEEIVISDVIQVEEKVLVQGDGFTPWSVVHIDGRAKDTVFVDENTLWVEEELLEDDVSIFIGQVSPNSTLLSQTEEWIYRQ